MKNKSKTKKLAILGASYLQVPLIEKAKSFGVMTHCFAWEEGAVAKDIADFFYPISVTKKELILEKCQQIGIDGIVTIATDLPVPTISFIAQKMKLIGNSVKSAFISTNKMAMRNAFQANGLPIPTYFDENNLFANINFNFPLIVKPTDRSGSRGVNIVSSKEELLTAIQNAKDISLTKEVIIESYIKGREISVETISYKGNHQILAYTDKVTTGPPHFVELEHHQPAKLSNSIIERVDEITLASLDALEITNGASHVELKIAEDGDIYIIEVGARMGGDFIGSHLVQLSTGFDYLKAVIDVALDCSPDESMPISASKYKSGVLFNCSMNKDKNTRFSNIRNYYIIEQVLAEPFKSSFTNSNDRAGYQIYQIRNNV